jgi:glycosyltransferase involved in cell wall biosynthesis
MKPHTIAMIHYKIKGTDGVSLEMDKWEKALRALGHTVYQLGGEIGDNGNIVHESLLHTSSIARKLYGFAFCAQPTFSNEATFRNVLMDEAEKAERVIDRFVTEKHIDMVIPENIWSVAMNPAVAIAMEQVCRKRQLTVLAQHHDFYWERIGGVHFGCRFMEEIADTYIPPRNKAYGHVVINHQGQTTLLEKTGLQSTIIPNVFDFDGAPWVRDAFNMDFRKTLGIKEDEVLLLQATRIVERKGIELAIDLAAHLEAHRTSLLGKKLYDGRIFTEKSTFTLVLAGYDGDDGTGTYLARLETYAKEKGVRLICAHRYISHDRGHADGHKVYSLWDTYAHADLITYPSYWEGWGNQFLEGLFARVPMAVFEYPVFCTDIRPFGFDYASFGSSFQRDETRQLIHINEKAMETACEKCISYLFDKEKRTTSVNTNFNIGSRHFSMQNLEVLLEDIIK